MKRVLKLGLGLALSVSLLAGCGAGNDSDNNVESPTGEIVVITREDGSGTRGAFVELTGVEKDKNDNTTVEAVVQNKTDGVLTAVAGDENSIGYISLGSLNESVKSLKIDGVEATTETIQSKDYKISRPFNIAFKEDEISELGKDFISFILSKQGQEVVSESYVTVDENAPEYEPKEIDGNITIAGSSSVTPVMEKLVEAYNKINAKAKISVQQSDSSAGVQAVMDGIAEIGMASRNLKDSELKEVQGKEIALDGIAVIVNKENAINDISIDKLSKIYTGEIIDWEELN